MDSLSGHLLIASPAILDPNFRRTVVFITAHTEDGAVGLILNRPSETTVGEAVPQLASVISGEEPVFVGGPVNPNGVAMLAEFEDPIGIEQFACIRPAVHVDEVACARIHRQPRLSREVAVVAVDELIHVAEAP